MNDIQIHIVLMLFELLKGQEFIFMYLNCLIVMKIMLQCKKSLNIAIMQNIISFFLLLLGSNMTMTFVCLWNCSDNFKNGNFCKFEYLMF